MLASERFAGVDRLYGQGTVEFLGGRHIAIVGVGGVGSWAAEALARSGVGKLTLIDADEVCSSNSNRQSHALVGNVGRPKVEVLAERSRAINPDIVIDAVQRFLTTDTLEPLLARDYDYVFDACDAFRVKVDMIAFCRRRKTPIIVCGSAGGRTDPTRIEIRDLNKTRQDIMLGLVRRKLREVYGWTTNVDRYFGVLAVYSQENVRYPQGDGSVSCQRPADMENAQNIECGGGLGAAMHVTAAFAMAGVGKIIERLLERKRGLRPR